VVKGVQFQNLRDAGDPAEQAHCYADQGADELVMLDVSATLEERATAAATVRSIRANISIPLTVGGGIRSVEGAAALLDAGADKIAVNTAAVESPTLVSELAVRFGRQCVVVAMDVARYSGGFEVVTRAGTHRTGIAAEGWAREAEDRGAGELLLTSWDRDGTRSGYDVEAIHAVCSTSRIPVIASGGAAHSGHLVEAIRAGADAVLAASIFHDNEVSVADVKQEIAAAGIPVRP
jgi:imidazoleglycerol phosphate synthase cyclase subunit